MFRKHRVLEIGLATGVALCAAFADGCSRPAQQEMKPRKAVEVKAESLAVAAVRRELAEITRDINHSYTILNGLEWEGLSGNKRFYAPTYVMSDEIEAGENIPPDVKVINAQNLTHEELDEMRMHAKVISPIFSSMLSQRVSFDNPEEKLFDPENIAAVNFLAMIKGMSLLSRYDSMRSKVERGGLIREPVHVPENIYNGAG